MDKIFKIMEEIRTKLNSRYERKAILQKIKASKAIHIQLFSFQQIVLSFLIISNKENFEKWGHYF